MSMSLSLALLVASARVLVDPFASGAESTATPLEEALARGEEDAAAARTSLEAIVRAGPRAKPAQAWRALRLVARHEPEVKAQLDLLVPALPMIEGAGHARALTASFEQALRETSALPVSADPAKRRGVLEVKLALRPSPAIAGAKASAQPAWTLEAKATLLPRGGRAPGPTVVVRTPVIGEDAVRAAADGLKDASEALARALVLAMARDVAGMAPDRVATSPRIVAAVAGLREQALESPRAVAVLDAFPAQLVVEVAALAADERRADGRADGRAWAEPLQRAFLALSADGLPLTLGPQEHLVRAQVSVRELDGRALAAGAERRYALRTVIALTAADGRVLAEAIRLTELRGTSAADAARGAETAARAAYDGLVDEVIARAERLGRRRAAR
jgi:hypothetical protein